MKWIGFLLVVAGTGGIGLSLVGEYHLRMKMLEQIRNMMHYINDLILYESVCLPEAFRKTSDRLEEPFCGFLQRVAQQMEEFNGEDISFLWKNSGELVKSHMNKKDYEEFLGCMQQTGFMDVKGQRQAIKAYEQRLELQLHKLSEQKEEKCKLYQTIGIMSGLFVCILLL